MVKEPKATSETRDRETKKKVQSSLGKMMEDLKLNYKNVGEELQIYHKTKDLWMLIQQKIEDV